MQSKVALAAVAAAVLGLGVSSQANAAYTVDISQVGPNVVATSGGTYNWEITGFLGFADPLIVGIDPSTGYLGIGDDGTAGPPTGYADYFGPVSGPSSFGPGGFTAADSTSGYTGGISGGAGEVLVPPGYGNSAYTTPGVTTWLNASIASLGLTPGTYVWTWGNTDIRDTFTLNIAGSVPEPATWTMLLLGFGALGSAMRSRRRTAAAA
jgi:PEP-CTERM motif